MFNKVSRYQVLHFLLKSKHRLHLHLSHFLLLDRNPLFSFGPKSLYCFVLGPALSLTEWSNGVFFFFSELPILFSEWSLGKKYEKCWKQLGKCRRTITIRSWRREEQCNIDPPLEDSANCKDTIASCTLFFTTCTSFVQISQACPPWNLRQKLPPSFLHHHHGCSFFIHLKPLTLVALHRSLFVALRQRGKFLGSILCDYISG